MKKYEVDGHLSRVGKMKNSWNLVVENLKGKDLLQGSSLGGRIVLNVS
jgi:hypothetical protein